MDGQNESGEKRPSEADFMWLRRSFELARLSREAGDQPFGALLVGPDGTLLAEVLNTRNIERDLLAHADGNVARPA